MFSQQIHIPFVLSAGMTCCNWRFIGAGEALDVELPQAGLMHEQRLMHVSYRREFCKEAVTCYAFGIVSISQEEDL